MVLRKKFIVKEEQRGWPESLFWPATGHWGKGSRCRKKKDDMGYEDDRRSTCIARDSSKSFVQSTLMEKFVESLHTVRLLLRIKRRFQQNLLSQWLRNKLWKNALQRLPLWIKSRADAEEIFYRVTSAAFLSIQIVRTADKVKIVLGEHHT